jgi:hypothetical protein
MKGEKSGFLTAILHLAPYTLSGRNVCPDATVQCAADCLNTAGRGGIIQHGKRTNAIQRARIRRTRLFFDYRATFLLRLAEEIKRHCARARRFGLLPAVRLNGTSDIAWERIASYLFARFSDVTFYDYTKSESRMMEYLTRPYDTHTAYVRRWPDNYHLTFSRSESNAESCARILAAGGNVAAVFSTKRGAPLPDTWNGVRVIDGDISDLRFTDPRGVVVGLRAKGRARRPHDYDGKGFVLTASAGLA